MVCWLLFWLLFGAVSGRGSSWPGRLLYICIVVAATVIYTSIDYILYTMGKGDKSSHVDFLRIITDLYRNQLCKFMNNRARPGQAYVPTRFEHIANMVTHGLIIVPAILGLYWMLSLTTTDGQYWSALVYGAATLALFVTSTTFHTLCYHTEKYGVLKECFHYGDRAIIYIFIAASYTPWLMLKECHSFLGTLTLWVVWISAAAGILYQCTFHEKYKLFETVLYFIIAVCPSLIIMAMKERTGLYEMAIGGLVYIIGVIFFKCDGLIPFAHAIWHCFVFVGVVFHYVAVCKHLLGTQNTVAGAHIDS